MLGFLASLFPPWAKFAALGVLLAVATGWHLMKTSEARKEGRAEVQAKWDAAEKERERVAAADALRRSEANLGVTNAYRQQTAKAHAAAAAARTELDQLRVAIADSAASAAPGTGVDAATSPAGGLLAACAERYQSVAAEADRLAEVARGLQDYAKQVCISR